MGCGLSTQMGIVGVGLSSGLSMLVAEPKTSKGKDPTYHQGGQHNKRQKHRKDKEGVPPQTNGHEPSRAWGGSPEALQELEYENIGSNRSGGQAHADSFAHPEAGHRQGPRGKRQKGLKAAKNKAVAVARWEEVGREASVDSTGSHRLRKSRDLDSVTSNKSLGRSYDSGDATSLFTMEDLHQEVCQRCFKHWDRPFRDPNRCMCADRGLKQARPKKQPSS